MAQIVNNSPTPTQEGDTSTATVKEQVAHKSHSKSKTTTAQSRAKNGVRWALNQNKYYCTSTLMLNDSEWVTHTTVCRKADVRRTVTDCKYKSMLQQLFSFTTSDLVSITGFVELTACSYWSYTPSLPLLYIQCILCLILSALCFHGILFSILRVSWIDGTYCCYFHVWQLYNKFSIRWHWAPVFR